MPKLIHESEAWLFRFEVYKHAKGQYSLTCYCNGRRLPDIIKADTATSEKEAIEKLNLIIDGVTRDLGGVQMLLQRLKKPGDGDAKS